MDQTSFTDNGISIGMPVHNGEKYIREAIESLLNQSYGNFKLIISDNASTDRTSSICLNYAANDARIKYMRQEKNLGAAANFRAVMKEFTGKYFMWASADDRWSSNWLECLHEKIVSSKAGMVFGSVTHIDSTSNLMDHFANDKYFRYTGFPLWRRIKFYLANESLGKANSYFSLYTNELFEPLKNLWTEVVEGKCKYDYVLIYYCLRYQKLEFASKTKLFKRVHDSNEGSHQTISTANKIQWIFWPILPALMKDYLRYSSPLEKVILLLLFPIKLLIAYPFQIRRISKKIKDSY